MSKERRIEIINHPAYLYARQSSGWISIFHKSEQSPTGVLNVGGIPNELEFLLPLFGKTSQLSPTEDLRSAK